MKKERNKAKLPIALGISYRRQKYFVHSSKEKVESMDIVAAPLSKSLM